ncbi:beta-L-arabinofuranosidase domain-containing protein [Aegicerativicinus sediminis]|uniref:beta-L-arabinofuranosidase domain-containing protein n=1 Tax=Aegicerativicinus sediminis TaxID=2893202 RepID=UPI001E391A56|nr:beta-L-arabinofuranosidase domain-containing protein [Aegicerativicinus sediminis]
MDGIGETGLIARYVLDGDLKDWSRNNMHAEFNGSGPIFVKDSLFKKVILLSDEDKNFISLPMEVVNDVESISITFWYNLHSMEPDQTLFDYGHNNKNHLFISASSSGGYSGIEIEGSTTHLPFSTELGSNNWINLALVINGPSKSMSTFINGILIKEINVPNSSISDLLFHNKRNPIKFFIGKSINGDSFFNGKLHDFRIYRIPLKEDQVLKIYNNSTKQNSDNIGDKKKKVVNLPQFPSSHPQLYNQYLVSVNNVEVKTNVGNLPRLPRFLKGVYQNGIKGPDVRVLWPEESDNSKVLKVGQYTIIGRIPGSSLIPKATIIIDSLETKNTPKFQLEPFKLSQVSMTSSSNGNKSKFIENRSKFIDTLALTNPDDFLYMFRDAFGQQQPNGAKPLGVWDSQETKLRGHATGHYLTALAQAYASTQYDKNLQSNFAQKMDYMIDSLYDLAVMSGNPKEAESEFISDPIKVKPASGKSDFDSDLSKEGIRHDYWNWGTGFISAYPPDQFIMLEHGATYGGQKNQIWAPYYTLHKILAGLLDIYEVSGNEKALNIARGMGNWVNARLEQLPTDTLISMWNRYIAGEFGGMNEVLARMFRITGDEKFLKTAIIFDNIQMFYGDANHSHGLAKNVDTFKGLHANQHIPQVMGAIEMYRNSNNPKYFNIADNFWNRVTNDYMYSIGGVAGARNPANAECFVGQPATLYENGFSEGGQNETCATYNLLKLTRYLYQFKKDPQLMDYYERGLYNHILASVAENSPANTYHVPLRPGSIKSFGNPDMSGFTCCNGTALESSTKLQNTIYFKSLDNQSLFVNLFIPSILEWSERGITVEQKTNFPNEDHTKLIIGGNGKFDLNLRVPAWATNGYIVKVNGIEQNVEAHPTSYITLSRNWKEGDIVDVSMPFGFHLEPVMDQQNIASLFYGPILLAAQESEPQNDWRKITLDPTDLGKSIKGDPRNLKFNINGVEFLPFYETYGRHSVYLDVSFEKM